MERYKFRFDLRGFIFVLVLLLPNILWGLYPSMKFNFEQASKWLDLAQQGLRLTMLFLLCFYTPENPTKRLYLKFGFWVCLFCIAAYYAGWYLFYFGNTSEIVLFLLTLAPCLAFMSYALLTRNRLALIVIIAFSVIHNYATFMSLWTS